MDRFGTRRVTLFFVWMGMALAPLFPLVPGFWVLLLLQLVNGAAVSFAWSGAQTLIAQLTHGDARYIGKSSFFARFGSTIAPILAGAVWDYGGAWPAYLLDAAWGVVLTISLLRTSEPEIFGPGQGPETGRTRFRARDALPRDHADRSPGHCTDLAIMGMRNTRYSIQTSVYVVYLNGIGLVGTTIGILFAAVEIASGFGSLFAGRAMRLGGRVGMWRGGVRSTMSVADPFIWRCLSGSAITPFPPPAHRTQQADFPHCALGQDLTPSPMTGRGRAGSDVRARSTRRGARVDSSRACVACPCA
jgi:MFS family permease